MVKYVYRISEIMALNEGSSFVVSSIVSLLLFSGMQMFKTVLASTQMMTILAGFTGSILYVFLLTAVANLEKSIFGFNFQTKLGEVRWTITTKIHLDMMLHVTNNCPCAGCVLPPGGDVRGGHGAPRVRHHLPAVLRGHDLVPPQDLPGHLRRRPGRPHPHTAQEEEVNVVLG